MVDLVFGADEPGGSDEGALPSRCVGDEGGVEVVDGKKRIEGALGHGSFGTGTGCGGRLARNRDDKVHEELGQLEVVNGGEAAEGDEYRFADRPGCCGALGGPTGRGRARSFPARVFAVVSFPWLIDTRIGDRRDRVWSAGSGGSW